MTNFRVGQKVVCIDDSQRDIIAGCLLHPSVIKGRIYTISGFCSAWTNGDDAVTLFEIPHYHAYADRFRALVEKKTDISIFKEILAGNRQPEGVEA